MGGAVTESTPYLYETSVKLTVEHLDGNARIPISEEDVVLSTEPGMPGLVAIKAGSGKEYTVGLKDLEFAVQTLRFATGNNDESEVP